MTTQNFSARWLVLGIVSLGLLLISIDNSVLYTALPRLNADLHTTATEGLWIINAYPLAMAGLLLGAGTLGDLVGHRRMFLIGLVVFGLASLGAAFSPNAEALIAARALLAVGAAAMMPATLSLIRLSFDDVRERNLAIAIWGGISIIGASLGPIVGGLLLEHFWWGSIFVINVPIVLIAIVGTVLYAPRERLSARQPWDFLSSLYSLFMLTALVFAIKGAAHIPQNWLQVGLAAIVALIFGVLFVRRQERLTYPLLDFSIFKNAAFSAGVLAAAGSLFVVGGIELVTSQRYQLVVGYSPLQAGLLSALVALGSLPSSILGGMFLHRYGLRTIIGGGFAIGTLGVAIAVAGVHISLPVLVAGFVITGIGLGFVMSVASTAIIGNVPSKHSGMASAVEEVSYEFGSLFAVAILGSLMSMLYSMFSSFPEGTPAQASDSITEALSVADGNEAIVAAAHSAFDSAYTTILIIAAVCAAIFCVLTTWMLRAYGPGSEASAFADNSH
ncbi:MFS transporter [Arcanobacterium haemolyticum]|nr:MFS transporter [Arcanobacterium haemolyticum]